MRFYYLVALAWIRGLFYKWPRCPFVPPGYTFVSCGFSKLSDCRDMYYMPPGPGEFGFMHQRWEPWCFQKTSYGYARLFRIKMTPEEIEESSRSR